VANFISSELTNSIASLVRELLTSDYVGDTTEKIKEIMHEQFLAIDEKLVASNPTRRGGSTGVVCITTPTKIIVANVGDSPCIAFSNRKALIDNRTHVVPADDEINCTELCLLHETNGHNPTNPLEEARIQERGGQIVYNDFYGDRRVKDAKTGNSIAVSRAFGQASYKKDIHVKKQIITAEPDLYVWDKQDGMMLALFSDSLTEEIGLHPSGRILANGKPERIIQNSLTNEDVLKKIGKSLVDHDFDISAAVRDCVETQAKKFLSPSGNHQGDNTTLILVDLDSEEKPIAGLSL